MKNLLRVERARLNLTQQELAEKTGVSRQTINSIETGRYNPSVVLAIRIAQVLETNVEKLFIPEEED